MAVFVFGAGATRGCSFVSPTEDPCLPPVDKDFFTQLQRVRNSKHHPLIKQVMQDVVELFGQNFAVTMETVFTTLEHTIRMLEVTGDNRAFKKKALKDKRERLKQAIAVVLEDAIAEKDAAGHSKHTPKACIHHEKFVRDVLEQKDDIITFNYDCVLDFALKSSGDGKWHPRYGYGFNLGSRGKLLEGDGFWKPAHPATKNTTAHLYRLHGALSFDIVSIGGSNKVKLKQRPYTKQHGNLKFTIIPPEWNKAYDTGIFIGLWKSAATAVFQAQHLAVIGYSFPETDLHSTALFRTSVRGGKLKSLVVVNPDQSARQRTRTVLQRGLHPKTKVLSFDTLEQFVAVKRTIWDN